MIGVQLEVVHWGFGDLNITVDGKNPASGEILPLEGTATMPVNEGIGRTPKISFKGGIGNIHASGRSKKTQGSGGICG